MSKNPIAFDPHEEDVEKDALVPRGDPSKLSRRNVDTKLRSQTALFASLAIGSIISALGFSALQEHVFNIPGFTFGGWMTFITYCTYAVCGLVDCVVTGQTTRQGRLIDYALVAMLAMAGQYFTNWALNYVNYTTKIVFKSCKVLPVMAFRMLIIGQRYSAGQYGAGLLLVAGITLFTLGDADGAPEFQGLGVFLIMLSLVCDPLTANLEERQFFRIKTPAGHAEVMLYLSLFAGAWSLVVITATGELWEGFDHSLEHTMTVPIIFAFSVLGYVTVSFVLLIIKNFGATNAEIVKSLRKVCQVAVSLTIFPKPLTWKYVAGGIMVTLALYLLQKLGRAQKDVATSGSTSDRASVGQGSDRGPTTNGTSGGL